MFMRICCVLLLAMVSLLAFFPGVWKRTVPLRRLGIDNRWTMPAK
jgi:hypothetical protein